MTRLIYVTLLLAGATTAQVTTSTIYGTIIDPSNAAVPGAKVTASNVQTGLTWNALSDTLGQFTITFLPVGLYDVSVEASGFKGMRQHGIDLTSGQKLQLSFSLTIGAATENVTVTAVAPLLNTATAEQRSTVETTQVRELPLSRRDWSGLLNVGAGIANVAISNGTAVTSMNGLPPSGFRFTIDGTDVNADPRNSSMTMFGGYNYIKGISMESIAEVAVAKGIASAEVANTMSGNVNVITRSGTNQFHGSLFENNQTENLNARNQFLTSKVPTTFNQFGGSFGGPIRRNKIFFFGAYEGYRESSFLSVNGQVPTQEFRDKAIAAVPAYKAFFAIYPLPNTAVKPGDITGFFQGASSTRSRDNHADVRGDYQISDRDILTARYTRGRPFKETPRVDDNARDFNGMSEAGTLSYTHISPSFSSQTRFGYNYSDVLRLDVFYNRNVAGITCDCGFSESGESNKWKGHSWTLEDVLSKNLGRHAVKWGGIFGRSGGGNGDLTTPVVQYATAADMLANLAVTITANYGSNPYELRRWQLGVFVQDDFRFRRNLVLNLGIRYDYFSVPRASDDRLFNRGAPFGFGAFRPPDSEFDANYRNFSPRVGFAWTLGADSKTVVRGGSGIFVSPMLINGGIAGAQRNSKYQPIRFIFSAADVQRLHLAYPIANADTLAYVTDPNAPWSGGTLNTYYPNPYSAQWMFSVQRQLTKDISLETAYVGSAGIKLLMARVMNPVNRQTGQVLNPAFAQAPYADAADHSHYNAWQTSVRKRFSQSLLWDAHFTWSSNSSYGGGDIVDSGDALRPQDVFNLRPERGPTPYDVHRRFSSDVVYELPFGRLAPSSGRAARLLARGWQVGTLVSINSGLPIAVVQPSTILGSRPDYISGVPTLDNYRATLQFLSVPAFAKVPVIGASGATARPGTLGRDAVRMPGFWNADLSLSKNVNLTEKLHFQLRADMLDGFNHTFFTTVVSDITKKNFGALTAANSRLVQLNARLVF